MNYSGKMSHVADGYLFEGNTRVSQLTAVNDTLLVDIALLSSCQCHNQ